MQAPPASAPDQRSTLSSGISPSDGTPHAGVVVTGVRLTWGDVWDVAFKFSLVFFLINAIGAVVLYLVISAAT